MRAKIMLLPGSEKGEILCALAEEILIEVSAAFNHSFALLREKIGTASISAYQEALTDETVEACQQCQAVLLCDGQCEGTQDLYDALNLPLRIRSFCIPESLCGRHQAPIALWVAPVLSIDQDTMASAIKMAFRFALEKDARITHVAPTGAAKGEWEGNIRVNELSTPLVSTAALSGPEAISAIITAPNRLGIMLCPPYAGAMLEAAASALCTHPFMIHEAAFDDSIGVYSPILPQNEEESALPYGCALAVADLLRTSLGLMREAACVEAAVNNVVSAHPGPDGTDALSLVTLICEQISVAGELMGKAGIH